MSKVRLLNEHRFSNIVSNGDYQLRWRITDILWTIALGAAVHDHRGAVARRPYQLAKLLDIA